MRRVRLNMYRAEDEMYIIRKRQVFCNGEDFLKVTFLVSVAGGGCRVCEGASTSSWRGSGEKEEKEQVEEDEEGDAASAGRGGGGGGWR